MFPRGVLPNEVIRDSRAEALMVFIDLEPGLSREAAQAWLHEVSDLISSFAAPHTRGRTASVAVGLGRSFFLGPDGSPRFGLEGRIPLGLRDPAAIPAAEALPATDLFLYVMATEEAAAAAFLEGVAATRGGALRSVAIERGFQRDDHRENFGYLDGLRNVTSADRYRVVFVNRDELGAGEPDWTEDGTYMAYLKVRQDLDRFAQLDQAAQDAAMGRRKADGSRLDLPAGTDPHTEPTFLAGAPASADHVRKAGPRGPGQEVEIFRRGVPYFTLAPDGSPDAGLHFVSFQATVAQFDTVLSTWMLNADFPATGVGVDAVFRDGLAQVLRGGMFFVPPLDDRFLAAAVFDPPGPAVRPRELGRVIVRKRAINPDGTPAHVDLAGCEFQVQREDGTDEGASFITDSAGHTISADLPVRMPLVLNEIARPAHLDAAPPLPFTIEQRREVLFVENRLVPGSSYGSGG
jgi:deferrochelatase/peroxidase EfeB